MITVFGILPGTEAYVTASGTTYTLQPNTSGQRYAPEEWAGVVCNSGAIMFTREDGTFAVISSGSKCKEINIKPVVVAVPPQPEPVIEVAPEPTPEAPAA